MVHLTDLHLEYFTKKPALFTILFKFKKPQFNLVESNKTIGFESFGIKEMLSGTLDRRPRRFERTERLGRGRFDFDYVSHIHTRFSQ